MYKLILKIFNNTDDLTVIDAQQHLYSRSRFSVTVRGAKVQPDLKLMWLFDRLAKKWLFLLRAQFLEALIFCETFCGDYHHSVLSFFSIRL